MTDNASLFSESSADFNKSEKYFECILMSASCSSNSAVTKG